MATEHGATTTPYGAHLGTLEPGKGADIVVMNWKHIAYPYLDQAVSVVDAVVQRAKTHGVETVVITGETVLRDHRFTRVDKHAEEEELARRASRSSRTKRSGGTSRAGSAREAVLPGRGLFERGRARAVLPGRARGSRSTLRSREQSGNILAENPTRSFKQT